ncbi:MAG: vWA domain-containing protein [Candidatus Levyibacteriota bacterium]
MHSQGSITLYLLLGIVILGAFFLAGGIPRFDYSPTDNTPAGEVVVETPGASQDSLQLKKLKFKQCAGTLTMDLLLDRSGSMDLTTPSGVKKLDALKSAVLEITKKLTDESIIGIQSFDSVSRTNDVPINFYKNVKDTIPPALNAMAPGFQTPTHDALAFSYGLLADAVPKYTGRKFGFIFITDGLPIPSSQDPRLFNPNPADQIKNLGVDVYTLGVHSPNDQLTIDFSTLLKSIASKPGNYYEAPSADDIGNILKEITNKLCSGSGQ